VYSHTWLLFAVFTAAIRDGVRCYFAVAAIEKRGNPRAEAGLIAVILLQISAKTARSAVHSVYGRSDVQLPEAAT